MKKVLHFSLSFLMIFTVAFATIETVDSEPVFAATGTPFPCKSDDGSLFGYQTKGDRDRGIQISQFNVETGTTNVFNTRITHLGGKKITKKSFQSLQASSMDDKGHMFMAGEVAVRGDNDTSLYYLEPGKTNATKVGRTLKTKGVMDASSYFEYGGEKFIVSANGFFAAAVGWKLPDNQNYKGSLFTEVRFSVNASSIRNAKVAKTDDIAWLVDGSDFPKYAGLDPSFVGYDVEGQQVLLGYITSKNGSFFGITLREHSLALPSDWTAEQRVGAVFAFGGDSVYAIWNANGSVRKISYNGSRFVWKPELGKMTPTSNNDGSACHTGTPNQYWEPSASYSSQSTCVGEGKKIKVALKNPVVSTKEGAKTQHYATYSSTDGQSGVLYDFTQEIGNSVTYFPGPAFAHGSVVTVNYTMTNLSDNEVVSGSFSPITINASECITTPTDPDSTFSQSLGSCSAATTSGTQTSTLSITNNASSTTYYKVEYSLDGGSTYSVAAANLSVAAGKTDT